MLKLEEISYWGRVGVEVEEGKEKENRKKQIRKSEDQSRKSNIKEQEFQKQRIEKTETRKKKYKIKPENFSELKEINCQAEKVY